MRVGHFYKEKVTEPRIDTVLLIYEKTAANDGVANMHLKHHTTPRC